MFEDLYKKYKKLVICNKAMVCRHPHCMHKVPHDRYDLGRPEQPENETKNWDCTMRSCDGAGLAYCE